MSSQPLIATTEWFNFCAMASKLPMPSQILSNMSNFKLVVLVMAKDHGANLFLSTMVHTLTYMSINDIKAKII